ncbi:MAG TPA: o-succinylbenzoate synthase [Longimicrobiales bacterium]|jgi:O-succinylbenzoate synthase
MKIDGVRLDLVPLRLRERFEISSGARQNRTILLVRLHGEGEIGWGECVAAEDPGYSYETTETAWHVLTEFVLPAVVGTDAEGPGDVMAPAKWIRGHRMAKAAVEMAAWDLHARSAGLSLAEAIGGDRRRVDVGVSVGLQPTDDDLLLQVEGYAARGYKRVKIKIKPGRDVDMLRRVRERFPDLPLMADANSAYTLDDLPTLRKLDALGLMMIEQPLGYDDLRDHARLQEELETSICLDESIRSVGDAALALELGAGRIINIKPGRVGGFGGARAIHDLCLARGVPVWCGGMLESGVGRAHNVALATLPGFTLPGDISESRRYWERDLVDPEFVLTEGTLLVPEGPGIGVRPDVERIEAHSVRTACLPG